MIDKYLAWLNVQISVLSDRCERATKASERRKSWVQREILEKAKAVYQEASE